MGHDLRITQLNRFTRARSGRGFAPNLVPVDLGQLCSNITEELRVASSVEIGQTTSGNLAGKWDGDLLEEVVCNLAGNAVDHAAPGTPVLIHAYDDGESVVIEITNHGVRFALDMLPLIPLLVTECKKTPKGEAVEGNAEPGTQGEDPGRSEAAREQEAGHVGTAGQNELPRFHRAR